MGVNRTMQKLAHIINLAPDWFYSNVAMSYYAASDWKDPNTGKFDWKHGGREATAGHLSRMFILKALAYAAVATQLLTLALTGKPSPHLFKVVFGYDKDGKEISLNLFARGNVGDIINWVDNMMNHGGPIQGTVRTFGNKLAAVPRAINHQLNNENAIHQPITKKGMHPVAAAARSAKTAAQDLLGIPFSATNAADLLSEHREPWEYGVMLLSGQPPQHITPQGMHVKKGQMVPDKPIPEERRNSIWDQIKSGNPYKSKKEMRDLSTPPAY